MDNQQRKKFDYKWVIVGLCFLMVFTCLGFCSSTKGLYLDRITAALGIKRSAFSLNDSCRFISTAIINIFFGTLVDRFGPKKLIAAGFSCLIASTLIYSMASNVFVFCIGGCLLGLGLSWTTTTMVGCVVNRWCKEKKGTIMGAVLAANGVGAALATQIVSPLIESGTFGYRRAYMVVACILAVVGILIVIFFKDSPKGYVANGPTVHKKKARGQGWVGIEYSKAIKKTYFYGAAVCIFFTGLVLQGISGISAAHMKDTGLDPAYVATVISCHSLALTVFKFTIGVVYDRFGLRTTVNICTVAAVLVMTALSMVTNTLMGKVLAMFYGIFSSLALPLETIMLPIYASDLFGEKSYNKMLGIFVSVNTAGYALGAPLANFSYDLLGSYKIALVISAIAMIAVIIGLQFVITAAKRQREAILNQEKVTV